jgi:hypothetical protein
LDEGGAEGGLAGACWAHDDDAVFGAHVEMLLSIGWGVFPVVLLFFPFLFLGFLCCWFEI